MAQPVWKPIQSPLTEPFVSEGLYDRVYPVRGSDLLLDRHSTATYMAREEDLAAAQAQLRHKSPQTTMRYDQAPVEDRRDALKERRTE